MNTTWTFPSTNGSGGQVLTTNGSGSLSWTNAASNPWSAAANGINYEGRVGIKNSTPLYDLDVTGSTRSTLYRLLDWSISQNGSDLQIIGVSDSSPKMTMTANNSTFYNRLLINSTNSDDGVNRLQVGGNVIANVYNTYSDIRIKKDIINATDALSVVNQLQLKKYKYIDPAYNETKSGEVYGVIAQEVEQVLPEAVKTCKYFLPTVMTECKITKTGQTYTLELPISVVATDRIRAKTPTRDYIFTVVSVVAGIITVSVDNRDLFEAENVTYVTVYGKEVSDFKIVDKSKLAIVSIGAIKEMYAMITSLQTQVQTLTNRLNQLIGPNLFEA
jgi:hypothetical protein